MHTPHPELTRAMSAMLEKLDGFLRAGGCEGEPVKMFLAGGMAMHFHCGARYTEDVDASFSARLLVPAHDLTVDYVREDGTPSALYFDANYNAQPLLAAGPGRHPPDGIARLVHGGGVEKAGRGSARLLRGRHRVVAAPYRAGVRGDGVLMPLALNDER